MPALNHWSIDSRRLDTQLLIKTKSVLHKQYETQAPGERAQVVFGYNEDERGPAMRFHTLMMDRAVWVDMGSPEEITMAIEPGYNMED